MKKPLGILLSIALTSSIVVAGCYERRDACHLTGSCTDAAGGTSTGGGGGDSTSGGGDPTSGGGGAHPCVGQCDGTTPECDGSTGECVECTMASGCDDGICDTDTHRCVECVEDGDCTEPGAARCDAGECAGCTEDAQCAGLAGLERCDVRSGECVECLPGEHESCGAGLLCHGAEGRCVEAAALSAGSCQPCVADAQCLGGFRCVQPKLRGEEGYFCLQERGAGCGDKRPFVLEMEDLVTIDGATVTVCGHRLTSCAGFNDFSTAVPGCSAPEDASMPGVPGPGDAACGLDGTVDNTRCRAFAPGARCTYQCASKDDCKCGFECVNDVCALTTSAGGECG